MKQTILSLMLGLPLAFAGCTKEAPPPPAQARAATKAMPQGHEGHRHEAGDPYLCPMHPEETGINASARCPICGMDMVPREK
jgi:hypothetical protein